MSVGYVYFTQNCEGLGDRSPLECLVNSKPSKPQNLVIRNSFIPGRTIRLITKRLRSMN